MAPVRRRWFVWLACAGLLAQIAALTLQGTGDVLVWETWAFWTLTRGLFHIYGSPDLAGFVPIIDDGSLVRADYPPLTMALLAVVARVYRFVSPEFAVGSTLLVFVKLPVLIARAATATLLWSALHRVAPLGKRDMTALSCVLAYWLNPALVLNGPVLGYLDPIFELPGIAAVLTAATGRPVVAGVFLAAAALIKLQGLFFALPVAALLWSNPVALRRMAGSTLVVGTAVCAPFLVLGNPLAMALGVGSAVLQNKLSAQALNVWWVVTAGAEAGTTGAAWWSRTPAIVRISDFRHTVGWDPRLIGLVAIAAVLWFAWRRTARCRDLPGACALGALGVHAAFVFGTNIHENYLVPAIPLAIITAAFWPGHWRVVAALTAVSAANMLVFQGFGRDWSVPVARLPGGVDLSVMLACLSVAVFAWHVWYVARVRP